MEWRWRVRHIWVLLVSLFQGFLNTEHTTEDYEWDVPQIYLTLEHSFGGRGSGTGQTNAKKRNGG